MIKRYENIPHVVIPEMKGGTGAVTKIASVEPGEYDSEAKVVARLILQPEDSIGKHTHTGEEEIITVLAGTARYMDGNEEVILHPGDVAVCRNGQEHSVANASDSENLEIFALVIGVPA